MNRPLVFAAVFYILGVMWGRYFSGCIFETVLFFVIIIAAVIIIFIKTKIKIIWIAIPFAILGMFNIYSSGSIKNLKVEQFVQQDKELSICGVVLDSVVNEKKNYTSVLLKATDVSTVNETVNETANTDLVIKLFLKDKNNLPPGMQLEIRGSLSPPGFIRNPGGFNEFYYMKTRGIDYSFTGVITEEGDVETGLLYSIISIKKKICDIFDSILPETESSIMKAIVIGEKSALDNDTKLLYRESGISHILAISGLHVSMLGAMLLWFFKKLGLNVRYASLIVIFFLMIYCVITGLSASSVRATIMICIILFGSFMKRTYDIYSSISLSALILLIFQPYFLWDGGFLLSYGAVIGIVFFSDVSNRLLFVFSEFIKKPLSVTLSVTIFTYPIVSYFFYSVSTVSLLINLIVIPLGSVLIAGGLISVIIGLFSISFAQIIALVCKNVLRIIEIISTAATSNILSSMTIGRPSIRFIIAYYILLLLTKVYFDFKYKSMTLTIFRKTIGIYQFKKILILYVLVLIISISTFFVFKYNDKTLEIAFLDVGQGDSTVLFTPDNKTIIIDGGGNIYNSIGENTGTKIVEPYLRYNGISKIDCIFLSHPDADHSLGVIEILQTFTVDSIVISDCVYENDPIMSAIIRLCYLNNVDVYKMSAGEKVQFGEITFNCIYPYKNKMYNDINNTSLTLLMTYGNNSMLFTGDIEGDDEEKIVENSRLSNLNIQADILKIPHHGSITSSSEKLLIEVKPKIAIVGAGIKNSYGHPDKKVLERYSYINTTVLNTAEVGAVIINMDERTFNIDTMKNKYD